MFFFRMSFVAITVVGVADFEWVGAIFILKDLVETWVICHVWRGCHDKHFDGSVCDVGETVLDLLVRRIES